MLNFEKDIVEMIESFPGEYNAKEIYHNLLGMGVCINEKEIEEVRKSWLSKQCRCHDDSGSCESCVKMDYA